MKRIDIMPLPGGWREYDAPNGEYVKYSEAMDFAGTMAQIIHAKNKLIRELRLEISDRRGRPRDNER